MLISTYGRGPLTFFGILEDLAYDLSPYKEQNRKKSSMSDTDSGVIQRDD